MRRKATLLIVPLLLLLAACDRTPVEPGSAADDVVERPGPLTLPGLLHSAVRSVYVEQGADAARTLLQDVSRLHALALSAPPEAAAAAAGALRSEQLRIVLQVHGERVVTRVVNALAVEIRTLEERHAQIAARRAEVPEVGVLLERARPLLRSATGADGIDALGAATDAAELVERARTGLLRATRVPSLDDLVADAAVQANASPSARAVLEHAAALQSEADLAVRSGDRERARVAGDAARTARIEAVLSIGGTPSVGALIARAADAADELDAPLRALASRRDVSKLQRMNAAAREMVGRAAVSLQEGRTAEALDLAAHAAGLLNAVRAAVLAP